MGSVGDDRVEGFSVSVVPPLSRGSIRQGDCVCQHAKEVEPSRQLVLVVLTPRASVVSSEALIKPRSISSDASF